MVDTLVAHGVVEAPLKYVALLRGINVGKGPRVPMKTLRDLLEGVGLRNVVNYLNSGNVVFESGLDVFDLTQLIEAELERAFGAKIPTLVKTSTEMSEMHEAIVWNIKREHYNRSQITKITGHRSYARMTTRNVNTARKLAALSAEV